MAKIFQKGEHTREDILEQEGRALAERIRAAGAGVHDGVANNLADAVIDTGITSRAN